MTSNKTCPLCERKRITPWKYENDVVWCPMCKTHPNKVMIVLKRHTRFPTPEERTHMNKIAKIKFPMKQFRNPASLRNHFHLHEL